MNIPKTVYQIEPTTLKLLHTFGTPPWHHNLTTYLSKHETLVARYAKERKQNRIPVKIAPGKNINLSPGKHSELIQAIIKDFAPRFAPASVPIHVGDTGCKWSYFDGDRLARLGVTALWVHTGRCLMWLYTTWRKTGSYWWRLSPAMGRWMGNGTPSWLNCLPVRRLVWSM